MMAIGLSVEKASRSLREGAPTECRVSEIFCANDLREFATRIVLKFERSASQR